jgi:hypothetical protein
MRRSLRALLVLVLAAAATSRLDAVNLNLGISSVPESPKIVFVPGGTFTIGDEVPDNFNDFQIDASNGAGDSPGLRGDFDGIFTIGAITTTQVSPVLVFEFAPVTGPGSMSIRDANGDALRADLVWGDLTTINNSLFANTRATINLTNLQYSGTNADLRQLAAAGMAVIQIDGFLVPPGGLNLTQVKANGGATDEYSGNMTIGCGRIGDFVWHDLDCDGVQDAGEPGIEGVRLELRNGAGNLLAVTTTDATGFYEFTGLFAGDYLVDLVESTLPAGFVPTAANQGSDDADSDSAAGEAVAVNLPLDTSVDLTIDFGFKRPGSIGDRVWLETVDCDGVQQAGEPGINGVRVELRRASDMALLDSTVTSGDGNYAFNNLDSGECTPPGGYLVVIDLTSAALSGLTANFDRDGGMDARTVVFLPSGAQITDVDFSFCEVFTGLIGDFVWKDLDCDGVQDVGEPGIAGVTVKLLDSNGNLLATAVTDAGGIYVFSGLTPGDYCVMVDTSTLPAQLAPSFDLDGGMDSMACLTLARNQSNRDVDFGYCCTGRIGDFVWRDLDCDGLQDGGEPGIAGVKVILKDSSGNVIAMDVTDAAGAYEFTGLCAGTYTVEVDGSTLPAGMAPTDIAVGNDRTIDSNDLPATVVLNRDDSVDTTIDFGYRQLGSIGDRVWRDNDCDGVQDAGEPGLAGVRVELRTSDGSTLLAATTTGANGVYTFANLETGACAPNGYLVEVDTSSAPLADLVPGFDLDGGEDAMARVVLSPGQNRTDVDFAFCEEVQDLCLVIIDEDGIDNDMRTIEQAAASHGITPDRLVNDDRPTEVGNPPLRWNELFPGDIVKLPTGEVEDEGWFALPERIRYADDRRTTLTDQQWFQAFIAGTLPQHLLDKVRDVMPLRNQELVQLIGRTCVAVVYDSDISMNYTPINANLQGGRYGLFTFTVLAVEVAGSLPESGSSRSLYDLWVRVEPPMTPNIRFNVPVRDIKPDSIQVTKASYSTSTRKLTVHATSSFPPTVRMTVSVDGADRGADRNVPPLVLEAPMVFKPASNRYEFTLTTTTNLKGRRLSIQTDSQGAYNVYIN